MDSSAAHNRPGFFVVGHSKSGTTALSRFLHQHPELFVCRPEETNYFCPSWCRAPGPPSLFVRRSEAEYLALFDAARPGQLCGEASAAYLYSPESARLIRDFDPRARIVMIFREPVDFLRSYHAQMLKNAPAEGDTVRDLAAAIALESARREGRELPPGCLVPEMLRYSTDRLRYDEHYDRFAELFGAEQIHAITYDDFRGDNAGAVRRVYEFLGVDSGFEPLFSDHNTGGVAVKSRRMQALVRGATHSAGAPARLRRLLPRRLRKRAAAGAYELLVHEKTPPVDAELAAQLRARATPHVDALGRRLGRDLLAEWGYTGEALRPAAASLPG